MSFTARASGVWVSNLSAILIVADCRTGAGDGAAGIFRSPGTGILAVCGADPLAALDERKDPCTVNEDVLAEFFPEMSGGLYVVG